MKLSREEIIKAMTVWETAWNDHNIDGVMELFHEDVFFQHWHGAKVQGKEALLNAWAPWFKDHGGFRFPPKIFLLMRLIKKSYTGGISTGSRWKKVTRENRKGDGASMLSNSRTARSLRS